MRRPNIILFIADQLSALALENYGNRVVKAPHIAALSERGTTFRNAYCNYPICAPSRYSMLSGQLPHKMGAWDNATELPASTVTLMHYLRRLGYHATLSGKMHFVGPDQLHGYSERLITDIYPANFAWVPDWREGPRNAPTGINMRAVTEASWCLRSLQLDYDEETTFLASQKIYDLARGDRDQPFFLTVSLTHPHSPFTATRGHWNRYAHDEIDMPATGPMPVGELDTHSRWLYYSHGRDRLEVTPAHVRNARHAYYGMISYVDDKVGALVKLLEDVGLMEDTIFVFCADHGEMMGERGMWFKQTFFEHSARVPLIIGGPGLPKHRVVDQNVSLVDLLPTLLALANDGACTELAAPIDGADLTVLMSGNCEHWQDQVISEYSDMGVVAPCRMVRQGRYKYSYTHGHEALLFDVVSDPAELHNLAGDQDYVAVEQNLRAALLSGWDPNAIHSRVLESQAARRAILEATKCDTDNWSFAYRKDDQQRFVRGGGAANGTVMIKGRARFPYVEPVPLDPPKAMLEPDLRRENSSING